MHVFFQVVCCGFSAPLFFFSEHRLGFNYYVFAFFARASELGNEVEGRKNGPRECVRFLDGGEEVVKICGVRMRKQEDQNSRVDMGMGVSCGKGGYVKLAGPTSPGSKRYARSVAKSLTNGEC